VEAEAAYFQAIQLLLPLLPKYYRFRHFRFRFHITAYDGYSCHPTHLQFQTMLMILKGKQNDVMK
jgi:hypothetical protein